MPLQIMFKNKFLPNPNYKEKEKINILNRGLFFETKGKNLFALKLKICIVRETK